MVVPLYNGKGVVGKIYIGILVDRVLRVAGRLIDDEQGGFKMGRGACRSDLQTKADRLERTREKCRMYVCFINLEKAYDGVNRETLWHCGKC